MPRKPLATRTAGPVGRDDVLAELRRVVDEAAAGRGHLLLLAGEAGIGKTTMLTAAADLAESGPATTRSCSKPACWPRPTGSSSPIPASGPNSMSSSAWPRPPVSRGSATRRWSAGPRWPCWPAGSRRPSG